MDTPSRGFAKLALIIGLVVLLFAVFIITRPKEGPAADETRFTSAPADTAFAKPEVVTIKEYEGASAQDPFISPDGQYLFFDDHSDANYRKVSLYYATRIDYKTFAYQGEIEGVNAPTLDTVPTMDSAHNFYWGTDRSYPKDQTTVYRGTFVEGKVTGAAPVRGMAHSGWARPDVHVTPDGKTLYISDFKLPGPSIANLEIAAKNTDGSFTLLPDSSEIFKNINNGGLNYAPDTRDGLELFFTHAVKAARTLHMYVARRNSLTEPFGPPELLQAATGKVEAASLAPDGVHLYYHQITSETDARIYVLTRQ